MPWHLVYLHNVSCQFGGKLYNLYINTRATTKYAQASLSNYKIVVTWPFEKPARGNMTESREQPSRHRLLVAPPLRRFDTTAEWAHLLRHSILLHAEPYIQRSGRESSLSQSPTKAEDSRTPLPILSIYMIWLAMTTIGKVGPPAAQRSSADNSPKVLCRQYQSTRIRVIYTCSFDGRRTPF